MATPNDPTFPQDPNCPKPTTLREIPAAGESDALSIGALQDHFGMVAGTLGDLSEERRNEAASNKVIALVPKVPAPPRYEGKNLLVPFDPEFKAGVLKHLDELRAQVEADNVTAIVTCHIRIFDPAHDGVSVNPESAAMSRIALNACASTLNSHVMLQNIERKL